MRPRSLLSARIRARPSPNLRFDVTRRKQGASRAARWRKSREGTLMSAQDDAPSMLLTVEELAAQLKLRPFTIRCWCRRGLVPYIRIGRQYRFDAREIQR